MNLDEDNTEIVVFKKLPSIHNALTETKTL